MARKIIKQTKHNILYHHTGTTKFRGCQCFSDCTCHEDFQPQWYDYYTVTRINKKTTYHNTLEEAEKRWEFVNSLPTAKR